MKSINSTAGYRLSVIETAPKGTLKIEPIIGSIFNVPLGAVSVKIDKVVL